MEVYGAQTGIAYKSSSSDRGICVKAFRIFKSSGICKNEILLHTFSSSIMTHNMEEWINFESY